MRTKPKLRKTIQLIKDIRRLLMIQIKEREFNRAALIGGYEAFIWIGQEQGSEDFISQQLYAQMLGWA